MKAQRDFLKAACIASILFFSFPIQNTYSQTQKNGQVHNPDGIELVYVEGSENKLGTYKIEGFYVGKYEITQKEWTAIMDTNPSDFKGDNLPVENVSWDNVQEFLTRLNQKTGKNYRLPTKTEWEYAANGGINNNTYEYAGSNNIDDVAWYEENSNEKTYAVGTKKPNALGIYDMSGNVWEWCHEKYRWDNEKGEYVLDDEGFYCVYRGGSWCSTAQLCRVVYSSDYGSGDRCGSLGFRVVLLP